MDNTRKVKPIISFDLKIDIPESEKWLYENKTAFEKVKEGLKDAAEGKLSSHGKFSKYITHSNP
jgi:hypothetical protein